jgi:hypothetical protein
MSMNDLEGFLAWMTPLVVSTDANAVRIASKGCVPSLATATRRSTLRARLDRTVFEKWSEATELFEMAVDWLKCNSDFVVARTDSGRGAGVVARVGGAVARRDAQPLGLAVSVYGCVIESGWSGSLRASTTMLELVSPSIEHDIALLPRCWVEVEAIDNTFQAAARFRRRGVGVPTIRYSGLRRTFTSGEDLCTHLEDFIGEVDLASHAERMRGVYR